MRAKHRNNFFVTLTAGQGGVKEMKNVEMKVEGNRLVITIDLAKSYGPSKSGKTTIIASTDGNVGLKEKPEIKVGLNVYK